jgi:hypothetical protein
MEMFRKRRAIVDDTSAAGHGFPDIVVNYKGLFALVEIKKDDTAVLTERQETWHSKHKGLVFVVRNVLDVDDVINALDNFCDKITIIPFTDFERKMMEVLRDFDN